MDLEFTTDMPLAGLPVGEPHALSCEMTARRWAAQKIARARTVGVGLETLANFVACGDDMMDCVLPTRGTRATGHLFTQRG